MAYVLSREWSIRFCVARGLHFKKPIEIELVHNSVYPVTKTESPEQRETFTTMLRYLADRRDYGLIYQAVIEVEVQ